MREGVTERLFSDYGAGEREVGAAFRGGRHGIARITFRAVQSCNARGVDFDADEREGDLFEILFSENKKVLRRVWRTDPPPRLRQKILRTYILYLILRKKSTVYNKHMMKPPTII